MSEFVFRNVPLPPSSNGQYRSGLVRGKIRHFASQELRNFKVAMQAYFLEHMNNVKIARELLSGYPLSIHAAFGFERSRLLTKKGSFKRLDVSNRLKALHDEFAKALLIDDCCFVRISAMKYAVKSKGDEKATVTIGLTEFEEMV